MTNPSSDVRNYGAVADDATDTVPAVNQVVTAFGATANVVFGQGSAWGSKYKFATLPNGLLDGLTLDVSPDTALDLPTSAYTPLKNVSFARQTRLWWSDIQCDYYPAARPYLQRDKTQFLGAGDLRQQRLTPIQANSDLVFRAVQTGTSDTFVGQSPTYADARAFSYANAAVGNVYGGFVAIRRGETLQAAVQTTGAGAVGVIMRHTGGYAMVTSDPTDPLTALLITTTKAAGQAQASAHSLSFPGRGSYTSYNPITAVWGVTLIDRDTVQLTLNGRAITGPFLTTGLGDIFEIGFVWQPANASASCQWSDPLIERNSDPLGRAELGEVRIFGDSTSDYLVGAWQDPFKDLLDHTFGIKLTTITNLAVSGTNSYDVLNSINTNGFGNAYYVVVATGTNDIQIGASLASSTANMAAIIQTIQSQGRVPIIVTPYMWYTQAQAISGRGQASTNYDQGAPVRARFARLCAETGAVWVDLARELAEPKPSYVTSALSEDPLVRDNIHPSALAYKLYAHAIARAIASHHTRLIKQAAYLCNVPGEWMSNGWSLGASVAVTISEDNRVHLQGNLGAGNLAAGTVLLTLPRWARPNVQMNFICSCNGTGGAAVVQLGTNGQLSVVSMPSNTTVLDINTITFNAV